jgi:hypothetical protein
MCIFFTVVSDFGIAIITDRDDYAQPPIFLVFHSITDFESLVSAPN